MNEAIALITGYKVLSIILVSFIAIFLILKRIKLGCYLGHHGWKKQESKIPDDSSHAYLYRECTKCLPFKLKTVDLIINGKPLVVG